MTALVVADGELDAPAIASMLDAGSTSAEGLQREHVARATLLVALGGDTTLNRVVTLMMELPAEHRPPLAFGGAPSTVSRLFALRTDSVSTVRRANHGEPYPYDVGRVSRGDSVHRFVGHVAAGATADTGIRFPWSGSRGTVTVDTRRPMTVEAAAGLLISNTQHWGSWTVAPRAAVMDGALEIHVFSGGRLQLARLRPALRVGMHARSPAVHRRSVSTAEVAIPGSWRVVCDGVEAGTGPFSVDVDTAGITILV